MLTILLSLNKDNNICVLVASVQDPDRKMNTVSFTPSFKNLKSKRPGQLNIVEAPPSRSEKKKKKKKTEKHASQQEGEAKE